MKKKLEQEVKIRQDWCQTQSSNVILVLSFESLILEKKLFYRCQVSNKKYIIQIFKN